LLEKLFLYLKNGLQIDIFDTTIANYAKDAQYMMKTKDGHVNQNLTCENTGNYALSFIIVLFIRLVFWLFQLLNDGIIFYEYR